MKLFSAYLRARRWVLLLVFLCLGLLSLTCALSRLSPLALGYGLFLALCGLSAWGTVDFLRFRRRHRQLAALKETVSLSLDRLPEPESLLERDYQQLLSALLKTLQTARTQADQAARDQSDYFTLWAHQIKTPIAAMDLILQQEEGALASQLKLELLEIRQYVDMALSYQRLESPSTDYLLRRQSLDGILRQAIHKFAPLFIHKGIRLHFQPTGLTVLTDEKWLLFVIEQLLSNALKYTRQGSISIFLANVSALVIQDTGIGIAPEDLPRVFELGFTGQNGRTDKKATGLGLYLCRRICTQLRHELSITARPGQGTRVLLQLDTMELGTE